MLRQGVFIMAKEHLIFDKTEIIAAVLNTKKPFMENIKYSDIINVRYYMSPDGGLFKKPHEVIEIKTGKRVITYEYPKEKQFWDSYKTQLEAFCARNRVSLIDDREKK